MTFLIDGYNLMHAVGMVTHPAPAAQFDRDRTRFLDWLADGAKDRDAGLRVIFDAQHAPSPSLETTHRGVRVRFAFKQTADDLIEELVAVEQKPATVTIVSNDSRIREAARRAECGIASCEQFTDWLISRETPVADPRGSPESDKPMSSVTDEDMDEWLNAFNTPKPKR